jgi:hypothetical protein
MVSRKGVGAIPVSSPTYSRADSAVDLSFIADLPHDALLRETPGFRYTFLGAQDGGNKAEGIQVGAWVQSRSLLVLDLLHRSLHRRGYDALREFELLPKNVTNLVSGE